jgi:hypothetical protein
MQFRIEADDKAGVAQVKYILESHVKMFSRKDPLLISWGADQE